MQLPVVTRTKIESALLKSGMLAVGIYLLHVLLGGYLWPDYSQVHQPISDLTATGAPNRNLLLAFTTFYGFLALAFAVLFTILEAKKHHKLVTWGGITFIITHLLSISYNFFPQDLPGSGMTLSGTMHLVVTALIVPFTIASPLLIGFGLKKEEKWKQVGLFSIYCGLLIIIFGGASAYFFANKLPFFGIVERLNIGTLQCWTFVLSYKVARQHHGFMVFTGNKHKH